jgi:hypothetical protein
VRAVTAEQVYLVLQDAGIEDEGLEPLLLETSWTDPTAQQVAEAVVDKLRGL